MLLEVMMAVAAPAYEMMAHASLHAPLVMTGNPVVARASLGIPDTLFIFVVALVVFGPKRLPEIGKQLGKLMFEFRRASNDFKMQIEEELRLSEQQEKQKTLEMQAAAAVAAGPGQPAIAAESAAAEPTESETPVKTPPVAESSSGLVIQPPSSGTIFGARPPNHAALDAVETSAPGESVHAPVEPSVAEPSGPAADTESATAHHG
jgi:sec-independent protein translocase protein TatB